jgi:hypothetical protein
LFAFLSFFVSFLFFCFPSPASCYRCHLLALHGQILLHSRERPSVARCRCKTFEAGFSTNLQTHSQRHKLVQRSIDHQ